MFELLTLPAIFSHPICMGASLVGGYFFELSEFSGEHLWVLSSVFTGLDGPGFFMLSLNKCIFLGIIFSGSSESRAYSIIVFILSLIVGGCFQVHSVVGFYVFFETSLLPMMVLILGWGYQPERLGASKYLLAYTVFFSFPFLIYILTGSVFGGGLSFSDWRGNASGVWGGLLAWFLLSGFAVKIPVFGLHLWLPKAHVEASSGGSMVLAGVLLKLGGIGFWRVMPEVEGLGVSVDLLSSLAIWGGLSVSIICVVQCDLKLLIAYSSVSHMSLVVWGLLSLSLLGSQGGVLMMAAHGFSSSGLFYQAGLIYSKSGSRSLLLNQGLLSVIPGLIFYWFFLNCLSMGTPPSSNFLSEIEILTSSSVLSGSAWGAVLAMAFFSVVYSMVAYTMTSQGRSSSQGRMESGGSSCSLVLGFHILCSVLLIGLFSGVKLNLG
uniref:NADH-ubiquinone oxidoreductase chain 4 n=1 Tax=Tigriopus californicus TaxID=6832 RepID=A2T5A1_TIGCA|nr:NADH dehydrogenase subunit 4 [Tigriopus californicus]